MSMTKSG